MNAKFKGTKGSWKVTDGNNVVSQYNFPIAIIYDGYTPHGSFKSENEEDRKANAKLIAAAPELLEALINANNVLKMASLIDKTNTCEKTQIICEEAIKRALTN